MTDEPVVLGYGKVRPRRFWWRAAVAVAVAGVGGSAVRWGPMATDRCRHLYWQQRVATFAAPPDTVAFEVDSDLASLGPGAAQLPAAQLRRRPDYGQLGGAALHWAGYVVGIDAEYQRFPWTHYRPEPPPNPPAACVFCHERRAKCGPRIVRVRCALAGIGGTGGPSYQVDFNLEADAWTPATLWRPESGGTPAARQDMVFWRYLKRGPFRVLAGKVDASDPSGFTIAADVGGRRHTVYGRLRDDGTVNLRDPEVAPEDP